MSLPLTARVWGSLFLPLLAAIEAGRLLGADPVLLLDIRETFSVAARFFPLLRDGRRETLRAALLACAALWTLLHFAPVRARKPLLAAASLATVAGVLGWAYAAAFGGAAWLAWAGSRRRFGGLSAAALAAAAALLWAAPFCLTGIAQRRLAWFLAVMATVKGYSLWTDAPEVKPSPGLGDAFLLVTGGFPCHFVGPYYSCADFQGSWRAEPSWELARSGIVRIYGGLAKLAASFLLDLWISPLLPNFNFRPLGPEEALTGAALWSCGLFNVLLAYFRLAACFELLQGVSRLLGHAVVDHFDRPWLSSSYLDFLRRAGLVNRNYVLKYAVLPAYRLTGSLPLALWAAFTLSGLLNGLISRDWLTYPAGTLVPYYGGILLSFQLMLLWCGIELWRLRRRPAQILAPHTQGRLLPRLGRIAATQALIVLLTAPAHWAFHLATAPPTLVPAEGMARRVAWIYGKLLFLR